MPHEPKRRHSTQRKGKRRASINLVPSKGVVCSNCHNMIISHHVCKTCGFYKGQEIIAKKEVKKPEVK